MELRLRLSKLLLEFGPASIPAPTPSPSSLAVRLIFRVTYFSVAPLFFHQRFIMYRTAAVRALRAATRAPVLRQTPILRQTPFLQSSKVAPSFAIQSIRCYSAPAGLSKDEVQGRIMDLLKNFDKVSLSNAVGTDGG